MSYLISLLSILIFSSPNALSESNILNEHWVVPTEVVIKSVVNDDKSRVMVNISLPQDALVGFEIYSKDDQILHFWNDQELHLGQHQLSLPLPILDAGQYWLHIKVEDKVYRHFVII